ncbi:MAG: hypothetical protein N3D80_11620 [Ignavibacterium album]|jgi:hypothetical protein|uniref:hypothetical protein n=1 Tax=Ignavibacterium album TaxID=591197 RepID=UPI0026ED88D1|nr:hypothetical protein [Ignavibacterium album]MCX8106506.1 hypothetical protein [Ignavibacterium album]
MGQQQLLLIVLGVIIVGIAVVAGILIFKQQSIDNKRDIVTNEAHNIATLAIQYYKKAKLLGGGQYNYAGWDVPNDMKVTHNGSYTATVTPPDRVEIIGVGNELVSGNDSIKVKVTIVGTQIQTEILN